MSPRIPVWCELVCRECSTTTAGRFSYGSPGRNHMHKEAMEEGWLFRHNECFCSRKCLEEYNTYEDASHDRNPSDHQG